MPPGCFRCCTTEPSTSGASCPPTLALIVQREAEIDAFKPVPFYTVALDLLGFTAASARMDKKADAEQLKNACQGGTVTVKQVERRDKSEKPPALYDLTTLQRDANRLLGFTAQQTLDYLQNLYEKKLCTYPRTDSRYLTSDMAEGLPVLVNLVANAMLFRKGIAISCDAAAVINDKKVTDHHAVIPTRNIREADLSALPVGERTILELVALRLLCAVAQPYTFAETAVVVECAGAEFTAKGRTVKQPGWRALDAAYRASMKSAPEQDGNSEDKALPELSEGQELPVAGAAVKEGKTTPPKHFTEDTLLSAMETAGKDDMPEDAERKGLGTPATRAGILEKLVSSGFLERKKSKKTVQLFAVPRRHFPDYRPAGAAAIPAADRRVGVPAGRDRARRADPGGFHGRDHRHAEGAGGDLSGHQGQRVPVCPAPRGGGQMPPLRRRDCRNAKRLLLPGQILQICNLEKQQVVGRQAQAAHQGHRGGAAERWSRPCDGAAFREKRQDLRRHRGAGGYRPVRQLQAGL